MFTYDLYVQKASQIFNVPYEKVTAEQRKFAKKQMFFDAYQPSLSQLQTAYIGSKKHD